LIAEAETGASEEVAWRRGWQAEFPKYVPFLTQKCGVTFRGRVLEIGVGAAWFSAELSKLPKVVEVIVTDASPQRLKQHAPKIFKLLKAHEAKITRISADFRKLDFPKSHFDCVVCVGALHRAVNVVHVLREVRRVLKPGGDFVAIREQVRPLVKLESRKRPSASGAPARGYTLADYEEFFALADLALEIKRVNLSSGFKYYFDKMVNGLTHARYAFVGTKRCRT
jgi:ubiquinone/menaquinone biosynthesis C-methylase UbiE